ncbi:unnamed protein product [Merluccius merluccius]
MQPSMRKLAAGVSYSHIPRDIRAKTPSDSHRPSSRQIDKYGGKDEHNDPPKLAVAWLLLAKHLDLAQDPFLQPGTF